MAWHLRSAGSESRARAREHRGSCVSEKCSKWPQHNTMQVHITLYHRREEVRKPPPPSGQVRFEKKVTKKQEHKQSCMHMAHMHDDIWRGPTHPSPQKQGRHVPCHLQTAGSESRAPEHRGSSVSESASRHRKKTSHHITKMKAKGRREEAAVRLG